jgi:uncharacterized protein (DUF952 family)
MIIFHITDSDSWKKNNEGDQYFAPSLEQMGFIHCCLEDQIDFVLERWFPGVSDLMLVSLESEKIQPKVVLENLEGGETLFPHVYGPIQASAIASVKPIKNEE